MDEDHGEWRKCAIPSVFIQHDLGTRSKEMRQPGMHTRKSPRSMNAEDVRKFAQITCGFPGKHAYIMMSDHLYEEIFSVHQTEWNGMFEPIPFDLGSEKIRGRIWRPRLEIHRTEFGPDSAVVRVYSNLKLEENRIEFHTWRCEVIVCTRAGVHGRAFNQNCSCNECQIDSVHSL